MASYGKTNMKRGIAATVLLGIFILAGCNGSTTTGGSQNFAGSEFVSTPETTGALNLSLASTTVPVGGSTSYIATVVNADQEPVSGIRVVCDTEESLALLEPTSGSSLTNSDGSVSGSIGCTGPGSFMVGCRLARGANKRQFVQVKCDGDIPAGFTDFPGAGGGGLGGGLVDPEDGGPGLGDLAPNRLRIVDVSVLPVAGTADNVPEVDTTINLCDNGTLDDATDDFIEPFGGDEIQISVINETPFFIRFTGYQYAVSRGRDDGSRYTSPTMSLIGNAGPAAPDATITLESKFTDANDGRKFYIDGVTFIPEDLGPRDVRITVFGETSDGRQVETSASFVSTFGQFNYCVEQG